jgi:exonuclease SbcD
MRILHTADWHLGRLFHGLRLTDEQADVLKNIIALTKEAHTDVVLIAGDIYDRAVPPTEAVELLNETLNKLIKDAHQKVILIAGNHDNPERLGFGSELLAEEGLFIAGPLRADLKPIVLNDNEGPVYFAPLPYGEPLGARAVLGVKAQTNSQEPQTNAEADLFAEAPATSPEIRTHEDVVRRQLELMLPQIPAKARKIALAHVFLQGAQESDSERPLSMGGTTTVNKDLFTPFNYTALGHLHMCQSCGPKIRYGGSLLKYSFNETKQHKGVHIIDLGKDGSFTAETISLHGKHELACLEGNFADLVQHPDAKLQNEFLQITLTDQTPVLDAKHRLDQVYPHVLQLQYRSLMQEAHAAATLTKRQELSPEVLFKNFYSQIGGRDLTEAETKLLQDTLNSMDTTERHS